MLSRVTTAVGGLSRSIGLTATLALTGCASVVGPSLESKNFQMTYAGISDEQAGKLLAQAEDAWRNISSELKTAPDHKLKIIIGDWPNSRRAFANHLTQTIEIPALRITGPRPDSGMVHEVAHLIAGSSFLNSSLLDEGLATYLHEKYSPPSEQFSGTNVDVHNLARRQMRGRGNSVPLRLLIFDNSAFSNSIATRNARRGRFTAYMQAGSFVKYLIETYGIDKFLDVYYRKPFEATYSKPLGVLEAEWKSAIDN